jgi:hypothetical protein
MGIDGLGSGGPSGVVYAEVQIPFSQPTSGSPLEPQVSQLAPPRGGHAKRCQGQELSR